MDFSTVPLQINIVPETAWYKNLRTYFTASEWNKIREVVYKRARYLQSLDRIFALCPACHLCKHPGFARVKHREKEVVEHLMKINNYDLKAANEQIRQAMRVFLERSKHEWILNNTQLESIKYWLEKQK